MREFQRVTTDAFINSDDLRRRFKDVRELVREKGNVGVLVNNRVDMVMMDIELYNELLHDAQAKQ